MSRTTVALVHGAWHGAWCRDRLCALIPKPGHTVTDRYREENVFVEGFAGNTAVPTSWRR